MEKLKEIMQNSENVKRLGVAIGAVIGVLIVGAIFKVANADIQMENLEVPIPTDG